MARRTGPRVPGPSADNRSGATSEPTDIARDEAPTSLAIRPKFSAMLAPRQGEQDQDAPAVPLADRVGDPTVTADELGRMGNVIATRHLLTLLMRRRADLRRNEVIEEVTRLLMDLNDGPLARRLLLQMTEIERIIDIYPLEVIVRMMERAPNILPRFEFGPVVLNADELTARTWPVGEVVPLRVPLNMRLKGFALSGGGTPGYTLAPGPLATYWLEMGAPGSYSLLFRGEVRRTYRVDRLELRFEALSRTKTR